MERTIRVTGKGNLSVKPDMVRLVMTMEGMKEEYDAALEESAHMTEYLKQMFSDLGFDREDIKTLNFNVSAEYESYQAKDKSWKRRFEGYKYVHRMKIEFPADNKRLGKVLYKLGHSTVRPEFRIEYTVAEPEKCKCGNRRKSKGRCSFKSIRSKSGRDYYNRLFLGRNRLCIKTNGQTDAGGMLCQEL